MKEVFRNKNFFLILVDLLMMVILLVNLSLIVFDWLYGFSWINDFLKSYLPDFYQTYENYVHVNFFQIDMAFITVFLTEFMISWSIAIVNKTYHRWFFYPFIHWYDLLGCIPLNSFRWVRVFRIFSILYRLHNLRIIDLMKTYLFQKLKKYYEILVEEVSDRVVINVIEGIQEEVSDGNPVLEDIVHEVLRPNQSLIEEWISNRMKVAIEKNFLSNSDDIKTYVENLIDDAIKNNEDFGTIEMIPIMGKAVTSVVKSTVSGVVNHVLERAMKDLASDQNRPLVNEITDIVFDSIDFKEEDERLQQIVVKSVLKSLDLIKEQVRVQRWKIKEIEELEAKNR